MTDSSQELIDAVIASGGKNIIQFDDIGRVTHATLQASEPMEAISERMTAQGIDHILYDGAYRAAEIYVDVATRAVLKKPDVTVTGDIRPVKADGVDTLTLEVVPASFMVTVIVDNFVQVHQEVVTDGLLEFQTETPGKYQVYISADHPYHTASIEIEAVA